MTGFQYITDDKGKRISVVIDLREHQALWEDFYDSLVARERANDETISWEEAKKMLHAMDRKKAKVKHAAKRQSQPTRRSKALKK